MFEIVEAYIKFLLGFNEKQKPLMPKFDIAAYTDNEYLNAINAINSYYENIDDFNSTLQFLKRR